MLGPGFPLDMLLYADDLESMGRGAKGRRGIPLSYLYLAALGYPFKWAKTRGGFRVEWLGMETEYPSCKLGLSLKRATWFEWLRGLAESGKAEARSFAQGLVLRNTLVQAEKRSLPPRHHIAQIEAEAAE